MLKAPSSAAQSVPALGPVTFVAGDDPLASARSLANPPLSRRGVSGKEGVDVAVREWSGKYHRCQVEISEVAGHIETLKRQRNSLLREVLEQEKSLALLEAQLDKQRDQRLPSLKIRYENASRLKHRLNHAVAEQRVAGRALAKRKASLARDIERKRAEVSSARARQDSISRKVREINDQRNLIEKQKAYRERQLDKGLDKLRRSQTEILLAEREILGLKDGVSASSRSIKDGITPASRSSSSVTASRIGTVSSTSRRAGSPVSLTIPCSEPDNVPRSARLKKPPPSIAMLISTTPPAPANTPVEVIERPLE
ncbi:hypothetical protein FOL47_002002 [Perkinsus chesapeaki]|uniref:Uncharacterized protein n=1 Tax=Perkinsus chesapeaki TaxID=330153 RepID=A0A7J6MGB2_PERCH|nr:hypothetical protein FOL47_002002 [Perkinsus chesapeaki]